MGRTIRLGYSVSNRTRNLSSGKVLRGGKLPERLYTDRARINVQALREILGWNFVNKIHLFRIGLGMVTRPHMIQYEKILVDLAVPISDVQVFAEDTGMRLTVHAHTGVIGIFKPFVYKVRPHLLYCAALLDVFGTKDSVIELHLGLGELKLSIKHLNSLQPTVSNRLALENDAVSPVTDLFEVCQETGTQFLYDIFHHKCWPRDFEYTPKNITRALVVARESAERHGRTPLIHISSQSLGKGLGAHADYIEYKDYAQLRKCFIDAGMETCDIMVEAGAKEQAVHDLRMTIHSRNPSWCVQTHGHRV